MKAKFRGMELLGPRACALLSNASLYEEHPSTCPIIPRFFLLAKELATRVGASLFICSKALCQEQKLPARLTHTPVAGWGKVGPARAMGSAAPFKTKRTGVDTLFPPL